MKRESMRKYSLLGLVLVGASAVTAAVLPKSDLKKANNGGTLVLTSDGANQTCQFTVKVVNECTYTATLAQGNSANQGIGSRTSTNNGAGQNDSSSITTAIGIDTITSLTEDANNNLDLHLHTSADN